RACRPSAPARTPTATRPSTTSTRSTSRPRASSAHDADGRRGRPRRSDVGGEDLRELVAGDGLAPQVALGQVAPEADQLPLLRLGLDAFGDGLHAHRVGEADHALDDRGVLLVGPEAVHEAAIDLDRVDGHALEVDERAVAGAEVVDGEADAELLEVGEAAE